MSYPGWAWIALIASVTVISIINYFIVEKYLKCEKCGYELGIWHSWKILVFLEIVLFLTGIAVGILVERAAG